MCLLARSLGCLPRLFRSSPSPLRTHESVLVGSELSRSFNSGDTRAYALKGVTVDFKPGELNLLTGPSGSGKSTLLAVLAGLLRPDTGVVGALGQDVWQMRDDEKERFRLTHCSYIFQGFNLLPELTAREQLVNMLRASEGCSMRTARRRADQVLGQLGLSGKADCRPAELSGSEKQRVAIGRALVKNATFIFADEPTSTLGGEDGEQAINLLREAARERGALVLAVTQDSRLMPLADRVVELADGQLQPVAKPQEEPRPSLPRDYEHTPLVTNSLRLRLYDPVV